MLEQMCDPHQFTSHITVYGPHLILMEKLQLTSGTRHASISLSVLRTFLTYNFKSLNRVERQPILTLQTFQFHNTSAYRKRRRNGWEPEEKIPYQQKREREHMALMNKNTFINTKNFSFLTTYIKLERIERTPQHKIMDISDVKT